VSASRSTSGGETHRVEGSPTALPVDAMDDVVQLSFAVIGILTRVAGDHDLSLTSLRLLGVLRERRPAMAEVAVHLGLERSSVSGLVDRVEARGLVERAPSPEDGRETRVSLSVPGRRLARSIEAELAVALGPLFEGFTVADQARLRSMIRRLLINING
jgi:MarR family transcriptional regulator, lower aerobic nicotinate degradation pathway regulator